MKKKYSWESDEWYWRVMDSKFFIPGMVVVVALLCVLVGVLTAPTEKERGQMVTVTCPCGSVMNVWVPPKPEPVIVPVVVPMGR